MVQTTNSLSKWHEGDVLQLQLDCDTNTLTITNLRSGDSDAITDLPATELFAYFATYHKGDTLTLVQ